MENDRPPSQAGITRQSSQSTVHFRDPDTATFSSQIVSTSPTSLLPPQRTGRSSRASVANVPFIINSTTTPTLTGSHVSRRHGAFRSSATWSSSSGELAMFSDTDEVEDRTRFVLEYNRLAKKHGIRVMVMSDFAGRKTTSVPNIIPEQRSWLSRIWHRASVGQWDSQSRHLRHRRSFSDLAGQLVTFKGPPPQVHSLQSMITLGGKSLLYLPPEFAPRALLLPTCFRATAQYLVQHGIVTRGVFRISGSLRIINTLYDYYLYVDPDEDITRTIRCPTLPTHIKAGVHDVASTFKRFLSVLPGGILGSLSLFDAFVAIHSQLQGEPEFARTRQTKLRARLIAMAIGTLRSQFRRELICAVFGLLSLIGRQAELTPHEDEQGRPLPTSDLMGYSALGIVFGPLLIGNLLDSYTMKIAHPPAGLLLFPLTPTKLKKERAQKSSIAGEGAPTVNKIHVANEITEMLITHWREVVRHLSSLGVLASKGNPPEETPVARHLQRSSTSDGFIAGAPQDWDRDTQSCQEVLDDPRHSPRFETPTARSNSRRSVQPSTPAESEPALSVRRVRPKAPRSASLNRVSVRQSLNPLSPTAEESLVSDEMSSPSVTQPAPLGAMRQAQPPLDPRWQFGSRGGSPDPFTTVKSKPVGQSLDHSSCSDQPPSPWGGTMTLRGSERKSLARDSKNAGRMDSKPTIQSRILCQSGGSDGPDNDDDEPAPLKTPVRPPNAKSPTSRAGSDRQEKSRPPLSAGIVSARLKRLVRNSGSSSGLDERRKETSHGQPPLSEHVAVQVRGSQDSAGGTGGSHQRHTRDEIVTQTHSKSSASHPLDRKKSSPAKTTAPQRPLASATPDRQDFAKSSAPTMFCASMEQPRVLPTPSYRTASLSSNVPTPSEMPPEISIHVQRHGTSSSATPLESSISGGSQATASTARRASGSPLDENRPDNEAARARVASMASIASSVADAAQRSRAATFKTVATPAKQIAPPLATPATMPTLRKSASRLGGVRAMAAMWEGALKDPPSLSSTVKAKSRLTGTKSGELVSPYHSNEVTDNKPNEGPAGGTATMMTSWDVVRDGFSPKRAMRANGTGDKIPERALDQDTEEAPPLSELHQVQLKPTEQLSKPSSRSSTPLGNDKALERPPSLGTMVPHQEEPPVDKHINFSRPPSAASVGLVAPDGCELPDGALPVPMPSPAQGGGNCLLHAQIRSLQKLLSVRSEEATSLRRQLETMSNMDIGTLSEQLRDAKRECTMWKARAEAAEKRVAVFEKFTSRIRGMRAAAGPENDIPGDATEGRRLVSAGGESMASVRTTGTEDEGVVAARIRNSLKTLDGVQSMSIASSRSNSGGAGAWWNVAEPSSSLGSDSLAAALELGMSNERSRLVWVAVMELLEDVDG